MKFLDQNLDQANRCIFRVSEDTLCENVRIINNLQ